MQCPYCMSSGSLVQGRCARCGYALVRQPPAARSMVATHSRPLPGPLSLTIGSTLADGRYRLLNRVPLPATQQRQGTAWSAIDRASSQRIVVVREIHVPPELLGNSAVGDVASAAVRRLHDLGQSAGFPKVLDFFADRGAYFMVQLYPEGESLAMLLKRQNGALPEPLVAELAYQVCGLLSILHERQPPFVHGSINPETIVFDENRQRAALIHLPLFPPEVPSADVQKATSGYYAPEQVRDGEIDPSSDLYGLAATMHHAVTGYDPHTRLAFFHPPARRLNPAVSAQMETILARQLSLSKARRYQHPSEMQRDLAALIATYPNAASSEHPAFVNDPMRLSPTQFRERALLNMGVFAAIIVLLLVGVLFVLLHP